LPDPSGDLTEGHVARWVWAALPSGASCNERATSLSDAFVAFAHAHDTTQERT